MFVVAEPCCLDMVLRWFLGEFRAAYTMESFEIMLSFRYRLAFLVHIDINIKGEWSLPYRAIENPFHLESSAQRAKTLSLSMLDQSGGGGRLAPSMYG